MAERLFPRALVACIGEDRHPMPQELAAITDKVWREAFRRGCDRSGRERAMNIAHAALTGELLAARDRLCANDGHAEAGALIVACDGAD